MTIALQNFLPVAAAFRGGRLSPATNLNHCHPERAFRAKDLNRSAHKIVSTNSALPARCSLLSAIPQPPQNLHAEHPCHN